MGPTVTPTPLRHYPEQNVSSRGHFPSAVNNQTKSPTMSSSSYSLSPSPAPPPPRPHEAALSLEASILRLILKRNRAQHHRARYFRGLNMVLLSLRRSDAAMGLGARIRAASAGADALGALMERSRGVRGSKRRDDERWGAARPGEGSGAGGGIESQAITEIRRLRFSLSDELPEVLSRILHAASTLCVELSQGYFVPLCTVSLACVGRIRKLLMLLGREGASELRRFMGLLGEASRQSGGDRMLQKIGMNPVEARGIVDSFKGCDYDKLMERFLEEGAGEHQARSQKWKREQILSRGGSDISNSEGQNSMGVSNRSASETSLLASKSNGDRFVDANGGIGTRGKRMIDDIGESIDVQPASHMANTEHLTKVDNQKFKVKLKDANEEIMEMMKRQKKKRRQKASKKEKVSVTNSLGRSLKSEGLSEKTHSLPKSKSGKKGKVSMMALPKISPKSVGSEKADSGIKKRPQEDIVQMKSHDAGTGGKDKTDKKKSKTRKKKKSKRDSFDDIFDDIFDGK